MLRAIIFDCDGVIADTEPLHLAAFQRVLAEEGLSLAEGDYYDRYLALDDRSCFMRLYEERGRDLDPKKLNELMARKAAYLEPAIRERLRIFPGVERFVRGAAARFPLAIASGALRHEIELILDAARLLDCFCAIVSAEDVSMGKPHPEPFLKALALINEVRSEAIRPEECIVVEDSIQGIEAARAAGMRCLAVTNSYGRELLSGADLLVGSLTGIDLCQLEAIF
jgi:HAD superfamily hydrolase (TIGR01509 family)